MLEAPPYLVCRALPSSCEEESKWIYNTFRVIELSNCDYPSEDGEVVSLGKSSKLPDVIEKEEMLQGLHDLSLSQVDQSDNHCEISDILDMISLLDQISKKISINSLPICLRADYILIASEELRSFALIGILGKIPNLPKILNAVLERPWYRVSEEVPCLSKHEHRWISNAFCRNELSNGKYCLEQTQHFAFTKPSGRSNVIKSKQKFQGLHDLLLSQAKRSGNQRLSGNQSDSSSLFHQIGRDMSINCLLHCSRSDYGSIASLNRGFRSLIRSGELYKLRRQMGIIEHWVYFSCNLLEWEAFDPICHQWMHLPRMTTHECFMCSDKESLAVGTELLVFGKEILSPVIYKYSMLTNSWSLGSEMNEPRCLFGSASLGEIAIVAGGCDPAGNILSSAELYNTDTGVWVTLPSMNRPRKLCSAVFMDGKFYVIGGIGAGSSNSLPSGEVYDLEARTWLEIPDMFPARNSGAGSSSPASSKAPPLVAVVKNELYAAHYAEREVSKYDKVRNQWERVGRLPERVVSMNGWGLAFRACGDQLVVIGGPRTLAGGVIEINAWIPDEGPQQWSLLGSKQLGSFVYNCAVMGC
ncbi:hypothetical protein NMG60_11009602 [Bertholletia excelsa]